MPKDIRVIKNGENSRHDFSDIHLYDALHRERLCRPLQTNVFPLVDNSRSQASLFMFIICILCGCHTERKAGTGTPVHHPVQSHHVLWVDRWRRLPT